MHQEKRSETSQEITDQVVEIVKRSGSSFYLAMKLLPKEKRDAMFAIYAFCREIDDIADEPAPLEKKKKNLKIWRDDIDRVYRGEEPELIVAKALIGPVKVFSLPKEEFLVLIDGMEMDIPDGMRAPTMTELQLYCRRVAGAVGMLSICVFGDFSPTAQRFAITLGEALQLTNILRDMDEDMELGRLYMPAECLTKAGIEITDNTPLSEVLNSPNLKIAREALAEQVALRFTEAEAALSQLNGKQMKPAVIMKCVYKKIFDIMKQRGWDVLSPRAKPSKAFKIFTALRVQLLGK
ncbi:MAG: presqualene diphosphate synthase HpnD [Alphaproteobacteria bacterium]|nr:presqualene diphosphate synthase HpnD [Alphaproteobacteria bacterium]